MGAPRAIAIRSAGLAVAAALAGAPLAGAPLALAPSADLAPAAAAAAAAAASAPAPAPAPAVVAAPGVAATPCGPGAAEVLARTAGTVAERIYAAEVKSSETLGDKRQIESYAPLLSAVASGDRAATRTAVHALVYSHTHIVRLRVSRGSELLADEGGPYILGPIGGTLRAHGRAIGRYVRSGATCSPCRTTWDT